MGSTDAKKQKSFFYCCGRIKQKAKARSSGGQWGLKLQAPQNSVVFLRFYSFACVFVKLPLAQVLVCLPPPLVPTPGPLEQRRPAPDSPLRFSGSCSVRKDTMNDTSGPSVYALDATPETVRLERLMALGDTRAITMLIHCSAVQVHLHSDEMFQLRSSGTGPARMKGPPLTLHIHLPAKLQHKCLTVSSQPPAGPPGQCISNQALRTRGPPPSRWNLHSRLSHPTETPSRWN